MKLCHRCSTSKTSMEFYKNKSRKDGLSPYCKECQYSLNKKWVETNKELKNSCNRRTYAKNSANWKKGASTEWAKKNPIANRVKAAKYRASLAYSKVNNSKHIQQEIAYYYKLAKFFTDLSLGFIQYEVDHIVPLNGKTVCGLHVPWNLQVLRKDLNASKSNKLNNWEQ